MSDFPSLPRPKQPTFERVLKDYENPQSLVNLVPPEFANKVASLPQSLVDIDEETLYKRTHEPSATTLMLRNMFWREYDRAVECRTLMDLARAYTGVLSRGGFYEHIKNEKHLAWIVCPPKEYIAQVEEMHIYALKQLRDILALPIKNSMGFVDAKLADSKVKIAMMLDMRLKGGYIQRSMQINQNINQNETRISYSENSTPEQQLDIDQRLRQLEEEIRANEKKLLEEREPPKVESVLLSKQDNRVEEKPIEAEYKEVHGDDRG